VAGQVLKGIFYLVKWDFSIRLDWIYRYQQQPRLHKNEGMS